MVLPVTALPAVTYSGTYREVRREKWVQAKPIDRPLPYRMYDRFGIETAHWTTTTWKRADLYLGNYANGLNDYYHAINEAHERLKARVSDQAGWGENVAQINQLRNTINGRAMQLARVTVAVKHGRFGEAARALRVPIPKKVSNRKAVSQNWLEYQFGIAPLINDLHSSINILTSHPYWETALSGRRKVKREQHDWVYQYLNVWLNTTTTNGAYLIDICLRTGVQVNNPNLFLANQLGFLDTALPWKLIPFSFIVDWFVNVEQVLSSVTDWYGCTLIHPHWSYYGTMDQDRLDRQSNTQTGEVVWNRVRRATVEFERKLGLPTPSLVVRPFEGLSLKRGLNAIALVLSVLGK